MIITFCGHANYKKSEEDEHKILAFLEEKIGNKDADIYLGGYGGFDEFAYDCCKKYQKTHPNISLIFITPYMTVEYQRTNLKFLEKKYDAIIYPEIENKPKRYAIVYRNKYMVEKADFVIAYVSHDWGGAYTTYKHAQRKNKYIFNLTEFK